MDSNLQISAEADLAPLERLGQVWLETKPTWADQWEEDVRLIPQGCTRLAGSQGAGELTFSYRYGPLESPHWMVGPVHLPKMPTLRGHWIRVRTHVGAADVTLWTGRITEPVEQIHGDQVAGVEGPAASGEQVWRALGPQALLERCKISRSLWSFVDGAKFTAQYLPWVPDFNGRRGEKGVLGNRSDEICTMDGWEAGIYVFGGHSLWRASDIVRYVLRMVSDFDPTGPRWVLTSEALLRDYNPHIAGRDVMSAAEIIATCSGVTRTSNWPIADWAVCGRSRSAGKTLEVTRIGTRSEDSKPNFFACSCSAVAPTLRPIQPKAVLQEISSAWRRVVSLFGPQARWS